MKPTYIAEFEKLGLGLFVHYGLYSNIGKGEWYYHFASSDERERYFSKEFASSFNPKKSWAKDLVRVAKKAGAKYITITTRHHDGFALYDSKGLSDWDTMSINGRDLIKEFVDACNEGGIKPFFYCALLDWHHPDYNKNFAKYIDFLINSIEVLCKNYGNIGGFWFDGYWDKPNENWEFNRLYKTIRKYQPEAMIINNTGLSATGEVTDYEIDSVTFERGKPAFASSSDGKERAGEVCEVMEDHWGYACHDINYKPIAQIISTLVSCRANNCNLLLNVGPKGDGSLRTIDKEYLTYLGYWIKRNKGFIYSVKASDVKADGATVCSDGKYHYAVVENVPMSADPNVQLGQGAKIVSFDRKISGAIYLDNKEKALIEKDKRSIKVSPFKYGESLYARVIRFKAK